MRAQFSPSPCPPFQHFNCLVKGVTLHSITSANESRRSWANCAANRPAFYLRMNLRDKAEITLVSDQDHFLFKPNTIYILFGLDPN
jgi:hypothetical protein